MKKQILIFLVCSMFLVPTVFAATYWSNTYDTLKLVEKNPSDWSIVEDGANGLITFSTISLYGKIVQERIRVSVWGLEPRTKYQLVYYGDETHNDVWDYATCIGRARTTSTQGYFKGDSAVFNWMGFVDDGIDQKFWVVLASDVDCSTSRMIGWNPTEYLFEYNII